MAVQSTPPQDAATFVERLMDLRSPDQETKNHTLRSGPDDEIIGVRMKSIFDLAKESVGLPLDQIEVLLESRIHEVRVGGVSVMDFQARGKKTPERRRKELCDLYLRRHDRIDSWDLVDRAAPWVVGGYLFDKPREELYELARSKNVWERRTAITSTFFFIRQGDVDDTFALAELLLEDEGRLMANAVGGWLREAGKKDEPRLLAFLDKHAPTMQRVTLRFATEKLDAPVRASYLSA
jgi:3-methyladenine DNA glycosylase AlkD